MEHVLFVVNNYPPHVGGVERHVSQLATELAKQGQRVSVVALADGESIVVEHGVTVHRIRKRWPISSVFSFPGLGTTARLAKRFAHEDVTVVSTHTRFFPMTWLGAALARRLRVPRLHTEHGSDFVRGVSPLFALSSRVVDLTLGRNTLRSAQSVLGVSDDVVDFVRRLAGVEATVFYNAITLPREAGATVAAGKPEVTKFVFVGRLVPGKGWQAAVDATSILRHASGPPSISLEILGDGPDFEALGDRIRSRGLSDIARVRGQVAPDEVQRVLTGAVLVNPTTLAEGFQTTLLEALAGGGQVVTYMVPGVELLARDGAPVHVVMSRTADSLGEAMRIAAENPKEPYPAWKLAQWGWPARAEQYLVHVRRSHGANQP